jgi:hypothetical protein
VQLLPDLPAPVDRVQALRDHCLGSCCGDNENRDRGERPGRKRRAPGPKDHGPTCPAAGRHLGCRDGVEQAVKIALEVPLETIHDMSTQSAENASEGFTTHPLDSERMFV